MMTKKILSKVVTCCRDGLPGGVVTIRSWDQKGCNRRVKKLEAMNCFFREALHSEASRRAREKLKFRSILDQGEDLKLENTLKV